MSKSEGLLLKYFILKPKGNNIYAKASRLAMLRYAEVIDIDNPIFANDLRRWVTCEQDITLEEARFGFKKYRRTNIAEMRPFITGEDLSKMSINDVDNPEEDLGMVARNPENHKDQWYVARKYFEDNFK
jgi:hypothetical protein